ncbi:MAG: hypothetical protein LLF89_07240 [Spirochaetaceae bacterium]|nr:hypothetical protein [Spirochaetaceae bacterium]
MLHPSELSRQLRSLGQYVRTYLLKTFDGLDVDLLVELAQGYFAFEIKSSERKEAGT